MHAQDKALLRQGGIAIVEFAVVLSLMLLLMLAVVEFGRALHQYNALTKAVRDGARHLATDAYIGTTQSMGTDINGALVTETRNLVLFGNIAGSPPLLLPEFDPNADSDDKLTVDCNEPAGDPNPDDCSNNDHVLVSATYRYEPIVGTFLPMFGIGSGVDFSAFDLTATAIMRAL